MANERARRTEYAVEVYNEKGFVRQIDVFKTQRKAEEFIEKYNEPLSNEEYLNITFIVYNENGYEVGLGAVV